MKYPIGVQDFRSIVEDGYVYVDKTALIYDLVTNGKIYFLSRPRRFGKSLLVSTLKYYFEGEKELFKGLAIDSLEKDWKQYPVFHLSFGNHNFSNPQELAESLEAFVAKYEEIYGRDKFAINLGDRFKGVIKCAHDKTGLRCVVLIDELDLHMHTSWQRKVLNVLRDTFPNIQFIITTHSPQILGEMDDSVNLLYLYNEDNEILFKTYESFVGWDANVILEEVMNTSSVNQDIKRMIDEMYKCIEDKKYDEAEKIVDILDKKTNGYADGISKARILISRGKRRETN